MTIDKRFRDSEQKTISLQTWHNYRSKGEAVTNIIFHEIEPLKLAKKGAKLVGVCPLSTLPRAITLLGNPSGSIGFSLHFTQDKEGRSYIRGSLNGSVTLVCQRCLEDFPYSIAQNIALSLITSAVEEEQVTEGCEFFWVNEKKPITAKDLIEEELLLSLPLIPKHRTEVCPSSPLLASLKREGYNRPFSALNISLNKIQLDS